MPMRDMSSDLSALLLFTPGVDTATPAAATVDLKGFEGCTLYFTTGVGGIAFTNANRIDLLLQYSDDGATFFPVPSADIVGAPASNAGVFQSYQALKASATIDEFGYKGGHRYLQATPVFVGTHGTGTAVAGLAVRGFPLKAPVS